MGNEHIVMPLVRGVLHKKLEELVLQTMTRPGYVPQEVFEAEEIAKKNGFLDIQIGIDEIFRDVGAIQVRRTLERRENQRIVREEREMQNYFIADNGAKLSLIEQGLQYQSHEKVTRAGRLDIAAKDSNGKNVTLELKARDYDSRAVFFQIMKYINEDETGGKLIFVAPEVKPELFFGLRQFADSGRIGFFEVERNNGDYSVRRVSAEDFETPAEIDWNKRARRKEDSGLVRVTAEVSRRNGKGKKDKSPLKFDVVKSGEITEEEMNDLRNEIQTIRESRFSGGGEIEQGSFHNGEFNSEEFDILSLLEKIAAVAGKEIVRLNGEKYRIPEINYQILVNSSNVELRPYPQRPSWDEVKGLFERFFMNDRREAKIVYKFLNFANLGSGKKKLDDLLSRIITLYGPFTEKEALRFKVGDDKLQCDATLENRIVLIDRGIKELRVAYGLFYYSREHKNLERLLARRKKLDPNSVLNAAIETALSWADKDGTEALIQALQLKNDRAKLLHWVDPNLAFIYMTNSPAINYLFQDRTLFERGKIAIEDKELREFIKNDQQLYKEILELIEPIPEEKPSQLETRVVKTEVEIPANGSREIVQPSKSNGNGEPHYLSRVYNVKNLTGGAKLHHPSDTMKEAPRAFAEDVLNNEAYSPSVRERMAAAINQSGWYSKGLSDKQVLNFFGDLRVYAAQGKVPNKTELKGLLENA